MAYHCISACSPHPLRGGGLYADMQWYATRPQGWVGPVIVAYMQSLDPLDFGVSISGCFSRVVVALKVKLDGIAATFLKQKNHEIKRKDVCVDEFNTNRLQTEKKEREIVIWNH